MTDEDLNKKCLGSNTIAQRQLFERFASRMMTVCRRYVSTRYQAEDVMQEAFIRVFSNLHQFRFQGSLEGWIRKVVVRVAIRYLEKENMKFELVETTTSDRGYIRQAYRLVYDIPSIPANIIN